MLAVAVGVAAYGLYLLVVGQTWIVHEAVRLGEPPGTSRVETIPTLLGSIPLIGGALMVAGVAARSVIPSWIGVGIITLFAALFLFSIGGILIPVVPVLIALLALFTWGGSRLRWATRGR